MADFLLDTNILIRHLRRHQPTSDLLATLVTEGRAGIATISRTEVIEGMREHERERTLRLLDSLPYYPLDAAIADQAGEYIRWYRGQGVTLSKPDAVIGATAVRHALVLVTYNREDFPMPELRLYAAMPA
ncbi:MAG: type II toxin-antitoxin system VapC family toxin [Chloroflexi bacterium]|nr:type II toxin-antitoxin system VapC family toxin [Chloroflexota bacterium]